MVIVRRTVYQCRFYKCPWKWNQNLPGNAVPCEVGVIMAMTSLGRIERRNANLLMKASSTRPDTQ